MIRGCESRSSCGCRLFNCTSVVILVTGKGCATGEGLLAVGERALVRSFARMRASMASERGAITEFLITY